MCDGDATPQRPFVHVTALFVDSEQGRREPSNEEAYRESESSQGSRLEGDSALPPARIVQL
jgi:hypothetical protein